MKTNEIVKTAAVAVVAGLMAVGTAAAQQSTLNQRIDKTAAALRDAATGQSDAAGQGDMADQSQPKDEKASEKFVTSAAAGNLLEVELGKMMSESDDPQVKQIAQKMVDDHTAANEKLQKAAEKDGLKFKAELTPVGKAVKKELQKKQGADRDRAYLFTQTGGHETVTLQYEHAIHSPGTPAVKQYARQTLSVVKEHEDLFKSTAQSMATGDKMGTMPTGN